MVWPGGYSHPPQDRYYLTLGSIKRGHVMRKVMLLAAVAAVALGIVRPVAAADLPPVYKAPPPVVWVPTWFVEGRIGASWGWFNDLRFLNPVGAANLGIAGSFIPLNTKTLNDTSWTAGVAAGRFITNNVFVKASYQYLGRFRAHGFADFTALAFGNVRQDLTTDAHALLVGLGADFDINDRVFVEAIGEVGVGFLHSTGRQGENVGLPNFFPTTNNSNFVAGVGGGVGYRATRNVDIMLNGNYYWLGKADTGVTPVATPTMNAGEQLQAKLSVFTATVAARARF
jgi:opacity protein-like surface antigen